jgi:DNA-binding NarL/FixJ family response regulator
MEPIRILIADDHTLFREGLRSLLGSMAEITVVSDVASGDEAVTQAAALQPDVILMDIHMPNSDGAGINGIEATRRVVRASPHIGVIMVTMFEDDDSVFAAMRAGARGYVLKGADQAEILRTIQAAARGEALFGAPIAQRLIRLFHQSPDARTSTPFPELSEREMEVLALIAQGCNNTEIASRLVLSLKTVRNHVSNILNKLQVADRAAAMIRARDAGLGM